MEISDNIASIACIFWGITFYWMVRTVRKHDISLVKNVVANPIWPNFDLRFFPIIYKKYYEITHSKLLIGSNLISFVIVISILAYTIINIGIDIMIE